jgi:hypothetical protein
MNSSTHSKLCGFGLNTGKAAAVMLLCLGLLIAGRPAHAMAIQELDGISPMSDGELSVAYGGFILPNGLNINLGLEIISAIKNSLGESLFKIQQHFSTGPLNAINPILTATVTPDGSTKIESGNSGPFNPGSSITSNGMNQIISNALNNAHIEQVQKLTIEISNFTKLFPASSFALNGLQQQFLNRVGGWH